MDKFDPRMRKNAETNVRYSAAEISLAQLHTHVASPRGRDLAKLLTYETYRELSGSDKVAAIMVAVKPYQFIVVADQVQMRNVRSEPLTMKVGSTGRVFFLSSFRPQVH